MEYRNAQYVGPRQVGKTTALQQIIEKWKGPSHYASADLPAPPTASWIITQWEQGRRLAADSQPALLVLDEVQKVDRWSEVVKALVDQDKRATPTLRVVLLGSAALQIKHKAQDSLAGRFELVFCPHWSYAECREAFDWNVEQWIFFGGYPEAAKLADDESRWAHYVSQSLIESVLSKDVLQLTHVQKPALLRQLFTLAVRFPAQILSFNKMLGQLQDAGNTVTLAHYLDLLNSAYLVSGLNQWGGDLLRTRLSSPKLIVWNNALVNALSDLSFSQTLKKPELWGRLVENAVAGHILNSGFGQDQLHYWRKRNDEVDFVLKKGRSLHAIEVKTGSRLDKRGLDTFLKQYPQAKPVIIGTGGIAIDKFLLTPAEEFFAAEL